jgi:hypothetical protein
MPTNPPHPRRKRSLWNIVREYGLASLVARLRYRDPAAFQSWQHDRDVVMITAALMRLSERHLNQLGISHSTLVLDIERIMLRAACEAEIANDVLSLVNSNQPARFAAE